MVFDSSRWNCEIYGHSGIDDFGQAELKDGIHRIGLGGSSCLDLLLTGISGVSLDQAQTTFLVCFGGAISNRRANQKRYPFFSGIGISRAMGIPLIAVSNPTLDLNDQINLAWYAGNQDILGLPARIAQVLNAIARRFNSDLVLFGGSGGGFAALSIVRFIEPTVKVFVWNPQTLLTAYRPKAVDNYLMTAFPSLWGEASCDHPNATGRRESVFRTSGIVYDLSGCDWPANASLILLQNSADRQVQHHAMPYLRSLGVRQVGQAILASKRKNVVACFGAWSGGHAKPSRKVIQYVLHCLVQDMPIIKIAKKLEMGVRGFQIPDPLFLPEAFPDGGADTTTRTNRATAAGEERGDLRGGLSTPVGG